MTTHYRAHARLQSRLQANVTHRRDGWRCQASVENIGLGGARVLLDMQVAPHDELTLSLTAPTLWDSLVLAAHVAWVGARDGQYTAGIAFEHASSGAVLALYELIATLGYE